MSGELTFPYGDVYPGMASETSNLAVPDSDKMDALNEDAEIAKTASTTESSTKNVMIALGVLALLVVFFGG